MPMLIQRQNTPSLVPWILALRMTALLAKIAGFHNKRIPNYLSTSKSTFR